MDFFSLATNAAAGLAKPGVFKKVRTYVIIGGIGLVGLLIFLAVKK